MDERKNQKNFIEQVKGKRKVQKESIGVYKYLVHHSFFDVLINAYPEFYKIIQEKNLQKEFDKSIFKFMQTDAFTPYIWQMPNEYRKFVKRAKYFKKLPYIHDLLRFEYSELFIFMQKKEKKKKHPFNITRRYKLSKNIIMHRYNYDVASKNYTNKNKTYILGYFDYKLDEVVYRPLDKFLYTYLKTMDKEENLKVNLRIFFKKNKLAYKDYAKIFEKALEELFLQKVLV